MRLSNRVLALVAVTSGLCAADLCAEGSTLENGNWYCQAVEKLTYTGVGGIGSYNKVTNMDSTTGTCSSTPFSYSGSLAPLNEEVSLHFRGPLTLKQFAAYAPSSSSTTGSSKKIRSTPHERRQVHGHGHAHFHKRAKEIRELQEAANKAEAEKRAVGDIVVVTMDGQVVSWTNMWDGSGVATAIPGQTTEAAPAPSATTTTNPVSVYAASTPTAAASSASSATSSSAAAPAASGDWSQTAYYNADSETATGITFLGNYGGQGSGVFDYAFGNSLSYLSADGQSGSASPEVLQGGSVPSNKEFAIFTDSSCDDGGCDYYRPDSVAYHGFDGDQKAFFFEFEMPDDGTSGWNMNMPAIWMLNANIPRTLQYGNADCSSWTSGGGEFDIFEVLDSGNTKCKSTLHGNIAGGSSDYFNRPTSGTIKVAVVMNNDNVYIQVLDNDTTFSASMAGDYIDSLSQDESDVLKTSLFALTGGS